MVIMVFRPHFHLFMVVTIPMMVSFLDDTSSA